MDYCPFGHTFGIDNDSTDECIDCVPELWESCYVECHKNDEGKEE